MTVERVIERVSRVTFVLPEDESHAFAVEVEWRGADQFAVRHLSSVLNKDGEWEYEPMASSRTDEFKERTRFDFETAKRLAREHAARLLPEYQERMARRGRQ